MVQERRKLFHDLQTVATRMRRHCIEMTTQAGSGHPTTSLSSADLMAALFFQVLCFDVKEPHNPHNDRFVLSKGHGSPALYAAWAEAGAVAVSDLKTLRRFDSPLEGHPTPRFRWVDVATGSLGQGLSVGVGMAIAGKLDELRYRVYVLLGDGETAEGAVWEAAALAAHRKLDNLVAIVDVNRLGQSEATMLGHDVAAHAKRFAAFGWHTITIDGHDFAQILAAFDEARDVEGRPVAILARTLKGKGVSFLEDQDGWHGKALDDEQKEKAFRELGAPDDTVRLAVRPPEREETRPRRARRGGAMAPPEYERGTEVATRTAYGTALAKLGEIDERIVALDGDVKGSTRAKKFAEAFPERFIESYIAEQNMLGMALGLQARDRVPFVATFACFLTRAFDQIRMAGISRANLKLCGSHAGVSIGRDGPSQMGLEDLAMMRAIPGSVVLYPSDAVSAERLVELAAGHQGIVYLRTTRPKTPVIYANDEKFEIGGCKVLRSSGNDSITIVAAGITVHEAFEASEMLGRKGIAVRVIDLYSVRPLDEGTLRRAAAETNDLVLTVEDHYPAGGIGEAVATALAPHGVRVHSLAVRDLPRSGAPEKLIEAYGIGAAAIARSVESLVSAPTHAAAVR
jgi:transketolase